MNQIKVFDFALLFCTLEYLKASRFACLKAFFENSCKFPEEFLVLLMLLDKQLGFSLSFIVYNRFYKCLMRHPHLYSNNRIRFYILRAHFWQDCRLFPIIVAKKFLEFISAYFLVRWRSCCWCSTFCLLFCAFTIIKTF